MPRRFDIHKTISLGFFNGREQYEQVIELGRGHLEFDGRDIYWVSRRSTVDAGYDQRSHLDMAQKR